MAALFAAAALYQVGVIARRGREPFLRMTDGHFVRAASGPDKGALYLRATVSNIGAGPARDIRIHAWVRATPEDFTSESAEAIVDGFKHEIDPDTPEFMIRLDALREGEHETARFAATVSNTPTLKVSKTTSPPLLFYWAEYNDVFYARHPRRHRTRWLLTRRPRRIGHMRMPANWQREPEVM
ncbi:MAG: hypothetical protein R3C29_09710 [Dehalococcoidia bacterium]